MGNSSTVSPSSPLGSASKMVQAFGLSLPACAELLLTHCTEVAQRALALARRASGRTSAPRLLLRRSAVTFLLSSRRPSVCTGRGTSRAEKRHWRLPC